MHAGNNIELLFCTNNNTISYIVALNNLNNLYFNINIATSN